MQSRRFDADENILDHREPSPGAYLIRSGYACRYNMFPNGQRQIIGLVLPGDLCDSRATMFEHVDYSVSAIDSVEAILIPADTLMDRVNGSTSLLRAICRLAAIEDAIDRRWLLNIGHRTALERVAHLLCEIFTRAQIVGLTRQTVCDMPLSQTDIADATALTPVHVNRMLMDLRRRGIISSIAASSRFTTSKRCKGSPASLRITFWRTSPTVGCRAPRPLARPQRSGSIRDVRCEVLCPARDVAGLNAAAGFVHQTRGCAESGRASGLPRSCARSSSAR